MKLALPVIILLAFIVVAGIIMKNQNQKNIDIPTATPETVTVDRTGNNSSSVTPSCGITASSTEGPYYVSDITELANGNLNYSNLPGDLLKVSGYVYEGEDNSIPISNAQVDIWQADNSGQYHPNGNGRASKYSTDQVALRGYVTTDEQGFYEFTTIYPSEYSGRTRHIHVKVRADGYPELTTQLIVPTQSRDAISFEEDTVSRNLPKCHLLVINTMQNPHATAFDFRLEK